MTKILIGAVLALLIGAGLVGIGWKARALKADSDALLIERAAAASGQKAGAVVVSAIGKLRPVYTTINNEVTRATDADPRYRDPACSHTDAAWLQLSAAYEAIGLPPLDRAGLPQPAPTSRPDAATDHTRAD